MSTDKQEASIPAQREAVDAYARKNGFRILREYVDEGISGDATEKRVQFLRMRDDAVERGDFEVILCWDQDRFGRFDTLDAGYWIKPFRDAGIRLETIAQGRIDWNDFAGRIVYAVQQEAKHAFLLDLSRNSLRGKLRAAREGKWMGGAPPHGYALEGQRLRFGDPEKVAIVQEMFERYAYSSTSLRALVDDLNSRGIPSPTGKLWGIMTVQGILTNPVYCGGTVWNRRHEGKYHGLTGGEIKTFPRRRGRRVPADDHITRENAHPAIIESETFALVQRKLQERRGNTAPHTAPAFRLSGLVVCAHCGAKMHGRTYRRRKRNGPGMYVREKYVCSGYRMKGRAACQPNVIHEQPLLDCVIRKLQEDFLSPENLNKLRAEIMRQLRRDEHRDPAQAQRLRKQISELDRKIDQGTERFLAAPADLTEGLAAKLREWRGRRDELRAALKEAERHQASEGNDLEEKVDRAIAMLHGLRERLQQADPAQLREVIGEMVSQIECWFEHVWKVKRAQCELVRGLIHLRPDVAIVRDVRHAVTRLTAGFAYVGPPLARETAEALLGT
jgi:DNA invertase Pin-like site-specific DNA recombinase